MCMGFISFLSRYYHLGTLGNAVKFTPKTNECNKTVIIELETKNKKRRTSTLYDDFNLTLGDVN